MALSHFAFRKNHKYLSLQTERNPRRIFHFYEKGQKVKVVSGMCFAWVASPGSFLEPCWASQHLVPRAVNPVWEHLCASSFILGRRKVIAPHTFLTIFLIFTLIVLIWNYHCVQEKSIFLNWLLLISEANTDNMNEIVFLGLCHPDCMAATRWGKGTFSKNHSWEEGRQGWVLGKQMNILYGDMDFVTN